MRSASAFTPELLNEVLVKCLCLILPGDEDVAALPEKLPTNVAARHRAAGAAATGKGDTPKNKTRSGNSAGGPSSR